MAQGRENLKALSAKAGDVIFSEGDPGEYAYIIESGRVGISITRNGTKISLAECEAGELFGEMAIIDAKPRSATTTALEDCTFLLITKGQLARRIAQADPILRMCLNVILDRFRSTIDRLQELDPETPTSIKSMGRSPVMIEAEPDSGSAIEDIKLEQDLERGIKAREFELFYQPIVDLKSGDLAGYESLVRWFYPDRGMVPPLSFIPTAEASGLILKLTQLCLEQATAALSRFEGARLSGGGDVRHDMFVSVNVSGRDFAEPDFVQNLMRIVGDAGVNPRRMKLEITESVLMENPERAIEALRECRIKGLSIAIDDFGTGYSSLGYLHKFPIDTLKIDRSFVMAMHDDQRSMKIIQSVLRLAEQLRIPVVAEGIETKRDASVLKDLGCEFGQGYLFAKPLSIKDADGLIGSWKRPSPRNIQFKQVS